MKFILLTFLSLFLITSTIISQTNKVDRVPSWAKEAVWYQIFPERFANGDPSNDPSARDMDGSWPYFVPEEWKIKSWTSDWYSKDKWELNSGLDFYGNTQLRRYGGDIQGVINRLDYLDSLGITAIYFNPVFEAPSLHKYDATMYHHIDNNFGPDPEGDRQIWTSENHGDPTTWQWTSADSLFLYLVDEAHKRDIKIIVDGVFNHTGSTFWAFKDVVENQQNSLYKDWYIIHSWDDPSTQDSEFEYEAWFGAKDLPEIKEDENGLVDPPAEHIHHVIKRWMDPNNDGNPSDGIDGWRLDVADMVNINFWKKFRTWVKEINPEAYITGEIWWEDFDNDVMTNAAPWLQGDTFDAVMNYRFTRAVKHFIIDTIKPSGVSGFIDSLNNIENDYPKENLYALMNLMGSHDSERLGSMIVNPDKHFDHLGHPGRDKDFNVRKPDKKEIAKQKLIAGMQMTLPGAPMIYYGDEVGMWGGDDPDCRKPMVWPDFEYETESEHPIGKKRSDDKVVFNRDLFLWYKQLITVRTSNEQLTLGELNFIKVNDAENVIAFERLYNGEKIFVIANNNGSGAKLKLAQETLHNHELMTDLISGNSIQAVNDFFHLRLNPYQIIILK